MTPKSKIYFLSFLAIMVLSNGSPLKAQNDMITDTLPPVNNDVMPEPEILPDVRTLKKTHPEKIIFTQYKLGNDRPDFDAMANASPLVMQAQDIDKSAMMLSEYNRISNNFSLHDAQQPIVVHTMLEADEYSSLQNMIVFDELDDKTFFRFRMYDYNVGIVPDGIERFNRLELSTERAEILYENVNSNNGKLMAEFVLLPELADRQEPLFFKDQPFWLMFAGIGEVRLWTYNNPENRQLIWYYRADDYIPQDDANLDRLYSE